MGRLDKVREEERTPERMAYAIKHIETICEGSIAVGDTYLEFYHNVNKITLYPYSGWFTGKGIKDGRGINELLKQLKNGCNK